MNKFIHLLYVPTMNCNMQCSYCYLGDQTRDSNSPYGVVDTLRYAVEKLRQADVIPFNISLHGGEVTTLSKQDFHQLIAYVHAYYSDHRQLLTDNGFRVGKPHIKTNLFGLDRHIDTIRQYDVSISGSLDLPLSLHRAYRKTKGGADTLEKILENVNLLASLPNRKKVSATIFREHFERLDEMVDDIRYLHENTCLDMNDFNFMIGFQSQQAASQLLTPLCETEQVALFQRMHDAFTGTDLQPGLDGAWFAEFTQAYCTNCDLCGEKFFLLERNGDVYSCVRGQGDPNFYYGNIYTDSVESILRKGKEQSFLAHHRVGFDPECARCGYLYLCKTGCPYVKNEYKSPKSYTCLLQKQIYAKRGEQEGHPDYPFVYLAKVHPELAPEYYPQPQGENSLPELIRKDPKLQFVYDPDAFVLQVDTVDYPLKSQLLKTARDIVFLSEESKVNLYIRKDVMEALTDYPVNNSLYMMLLHSKMVIYGDEQRPKQEHVMTHQVFTNALASNFSDRPGYYCLDLLPVLMPYVRYLEPAEPANLFFTTSALRDYHYAKQKNNGFYHIAALNLPFQNIEFYYVDIQEAMSDEYSAQKL